MRIVEIQVLKVETNNNIVFLTATCAMRQMCPLITLDLIYNCGSQA